VKEATRLPFKTEQAVEVRWLPAARSALGEARFSSVHAQGRALSLLEAVHQA
jgi:hypothetical protein